MKLIPRTALFALLTLSLAGCGGSDDAGSSGGTFQGTYSGAYTAPRNETGTMEVTIASDGTFSATAISNGGGETATVNGHIDRSGAFDGTVTFDSTTVDATGSFARDEDGRITGTITGNSGSQTVTLTIDITPSR